MRLTPTLRTIISGFAFASFGLTAAPVFAADEINLYTTREPRLILPILESFTNETDIKVNTVFVKDGLIERVRRRANSPLLIF